MKFIQIRAMYLLVSLSRKSRSRFHHQSRNPEFPRPMIPSPENRDLGPGFRDFRDSRFPDRVTLVRRLQWRGIIQLWRTVLTVEGSKVLNRRREPQLREEVRIRILFREGGNLNTRGKVERSEAFMSYVYMKKSDKNSVVQLIPVVFCSMEWGLLKNDAK